MSHSVFKKVVMFCGLGTLCGSVFALPLSTDESCKASAVGELSQMFSCGTVEGSLRLNSFSLNNAYFSGSSQDTTTAGGYLTYKTARYNGLQLALGVEGQYRLAEGANNIAELSDDTFGIGEAYLNWTQDKFSVTIGNQKLNLPFTGDYSYYRVQPWLYQGIDMKYGDADNFVRATKITKYKNYGDDNFNKGSRLKDDAFLYDNNGNKYDSETDGMIAFGVGKKFDLNDKYLKAQVWAEQYQDLLNLYYAEFNFGMPNLTWKPEFSVQGIYGEDTGDAYLGKVDSTSIGAQVVLKPTDKLTWKLGYDHVFKQKDAWHNGSLPTPYAHNTSSDPYFAQPFFTSTQDLGAGDFVKTELSRPFGENFFGGTKISYAKADNTPYAPNNSNMYEVMFYGFYNFTGALKGLSIAEFVGAQKHEGDANAFLQNRLALSYNF
ncbi:hypothetical protein GCM10023206_02320 [Acinetobacter puyangensis]|uniref:Outer membrane porin, OprD family n=1 Tax=Acinetobacter puyangensis TaxID=1096779 RepID=A0A240E6P0_9GAMM|nr:hypothetical protein [Acinetobacter puyangensis]SNX44417.1 hypothetical protein SAMN05421731_103155 [Acinetobacter puyangensis]